MTALFADKKGEKQILSGCRHMEVRDMKRVRLIVAYDGTNYKGWQVQPNGITIEEVLNRELSRLLGEEIVVSGASRTDSGVHSLGNVAVFDTETRMPAEKISFALNQRLPVESVGLLRGGSGLAPAVRTQQKDLRVSYSKPHVSYADKTA